MSLQIIIVIYNKNVLQIKYYFSIVVLWTMVRLLKYEVLKYYKTFIFEKKCYI